MTDIVPIRRAILSVSDKTDLVALGRSLADRGVSLLASGGTHSALRAAGLDPIEVANVTGQPEILGGRVKTLHPAIHAGILARRSIPNDLQALRDSGFEPIDLVVVNLYPFRETIAKPGVSFEEAIENIDIGGPSLLRAAAKNQDHVAVLSAPFQYAEFIEQLNRAGGTTLAQRRRLALEAFRLTASYDEAIAAHLSSVIQPEAEPPSFSDILSLQFQLRGRLRYGENPHQHAAFYVEPAAIGPNLATAEIRHGKELSYNNLLDLDAALRLIRQFQSPAACILKHNNPCGAAEAETLAEAFELAYEGDPVSAFGGIVGVNRPVDAETAALMAKPGRFIECVLAPGYSPEAFEILTTRPSWKNSVRLVDLAAPIGPSSPPPSGTDLRRIEGGLLAQDWDSTEADPSKWAIGSKRSPSPAERASLEFAWKVCAAVKSNAIVIAKGRQVVGVGAGQMSRLDSVRIAVEKAAGRAAGAALASDAFFPFRDGPDLAAQAGITAIVQPGGSKRDAETFAAVDEHGIALLLTGTRHFRH